MRFSNLALMTIAVAIACRVPALSVAQTPEQLTLRRHFDRILESVAKESRRALPGLLLYPQEVREAVLVISQNPELVVRLFALGERAGQAHSAVIEGYAEDIADAAALLSGHLDVLEILQDNLVATSVVGRVYADNPAFIMRAINKTAQQAQAEHAESVDAWVQRLRDAPETLQELQNASNEYADEMGFQTETETETDEPPVTITQEEGYDTLDDDDWYEAYGYYWVPSGIVIGDLPSGRFLEWLLEHCDKFPDLVDQIIDHIRQRRTQIDLRGEMAGVLDRWQEKYPFTTMQGFLNNDGNRRERLREFGSLLKEAGSGGVPDKQPANLRQLISQNQDRFPNLSRPASPDRTKRGGRPRPVQPPVARDRPGSGQDRVARTPRADGRNIRRITPSQRQQMQRATMRHRTAWRGSQRSRYRGSRRGGARGGGRRR